MAQSRGRRGRALGQAGEAPLPRDKAPLSSLQLGRKGRGEGLVHGTARGGGRGLALCEAPKGSVGLETAPHTHRMGPLAACLPGRSRGHRERGGGGRREPLTQAGGARALLTSGKPRPSRGRRPPGAPVPPPGARLTVLVSVLQAWPRLSPQGAGPPAGEGVAPALIPLWGGPCCHKAQSRPRFGRLGWGSGAASEPTHSGSVQKSQHPLPPALEGQWGQHVVSLLDIQALRKAGGGWARGGSGRVVQSLPVLGAVPTGVDKATSHLGPRPTTPGPRRGKAWARAEARPGSACS